jgi:hypothetical protein
MQSTNKTVKLFLTSSSYKVRMGNKQYSHEQ